MLCRFEARASMLRGGLSRMCATTTTTTKHKPRRAAPPSPNASLHRYLSTDQIWGTFIELPQICRHHNHKSNAAHFSSYCFKEDEDSYFSTNTATAVAWETLEDEIRDANARYARRIVVETQNGTGWGVTAASDFAPGSVLFVGRSSSSTSLATTTRRTTRSTAPDAHTIQVQRGEHVRMDLPARFLNHACGSGANVGVRRHATATTSYGVGENQGTIVYEFVAKRNIAAGEMLRYDYETTEWRLQSPFECSCGSPDCRGTIVGFGLALARGGQLYPLLQPQYRLWIAPHVRKMMEEELKNVQTR